MAIACYKHPQAPSVATCRNCTRGLCVDCESGPASLCGTYAREVTSNAKTTVVLRAAGALIAGFVGSFILGAATTPAGAAHATPLASRLIGFYLGAGAVYGAKFVQYPLRGWIVSPLFWFVGKLGQIFLGILFGAVALPFQVASDIRTLLRMPSRS